MDLFAFSGKCRAFRSFAMLFRVVELCVVLVLLSWTYSRVPLAVRISGEYGRQLFRFLLSPLFCFVLCNAIVVTLLFKPRGFSVHCAVATDDTEAELYEDLIDNSRHHPELRSEKKRLSSDADEVVFQDKEIVSEGKSEVAKVDSDAESDSDRGSEAPKVYRREKIKRQEAPEKAGEKLRRSETEKCSNIEDYSVYPEGSLYCQDDMSNDELKEKIEAFIAKELRFRREEALAIVI